MHVPCKLLAVCVYLQIDHVVINIHYYKELGGICDYNIMQMKLFTLVWRNVYVQVLEKSQKGHYAYISTP